jgi:hypothetical protein
MELRSFNVERVWREVVKVRIGDAIGVDHDALHQHTDDIKDMLSQLSQTEGVARTFNKRSDGETWTPYMQIVEMLLLLGSKVGCVRIKGDLNPQTPIKIVL